MKETDAISVAIGMYNDGYDKGIDDLLEKVKELYPNDEIAIYKLTSIAEQLKEQNK